MATHKVLDERTLEVLWVIARNGHATERVILHTLRKHDKAFRNRHDLYRCLQKLRDHQLITYQEDVGEYLMDRKAVYARRKEEQDHYATIMHLWDKIKDEHEWNRTFGSPP